jgi:hypothetical protein
MREKLSKLIETVERWRSELEIWHIPGVCTLKAAIDRNSFALLPEAEANSLEPTSKESPPDNHRR